MAGPRITSGSDSRQDYQTPDDFLHGAVEKRFGPIQFDLAAHAGNARHSRYFAPPTLTRKIDLGKVKDGTYFTDLLSGLQRHGADPVEAAKLLSPVEQRWRDGDESDDVELVFKNVDKNAYGFDAFSYSWAELSRKFRQPDGGPGILWLNCEFSDISPWAVKAEREGTDGANVLLLTPAAVGSNWYRDLIAGKADGDLLNGRLCFDGKNVFPKDCMLSHFHSEAKGDLAIWNWKANKFHLAWELKG